MMKVNYVILICLVALGMPENTNAQANQYRATATVSAREEVRLQPAQTAQESPPAFAHRFLDVERISMPEQWNELSSFFAGTPKPQWNKVHIVDIVDVGVENQGDTADVSVSTNWLGDLNGTLQLSSYPSRRLPLTVPSASACYGDHYFDFDLVLSQPSKGNSAWKVKKSSFEPIITLDAAIRYVTETNSKTTDPTRKENAPRTLSILNYFHNHPGKPLPNKLASRAGNGCS